MGATVKGSMYQRMKDAGIDMSWYERGKSKIREAVPLEDDACSQASIYLMRTDGTLWTLDVVERRAGGEVVTDIKPHKQVRSTNRTIPEPLYVCMHTKESYRQFSDAVGHGTCKKSKQSSKEVI
jgi:hypothetical protein